MRALLCLTLLLCWLPATAEVYRWTDDKGVIHYTDKPPASNAKPAELPALQTYRPSSPPPVADTAPADAAAAPGANSGIVIATPQAEETIRDGEGNVPVAVAAALQPGQGIVYYLDGRAQNDSPTPSTGFLLSGVERGEHQVSAAIVAADGHELSRAAPVTIYVQKVSRLH